MKGFILNIVRVRDEDLLVTLLTDQEVITLYRFYGARHSYINIGYHIDFEIEESEKTTLKRLRNVTQLGFSFLLDYEKMLIWQQFTKLLNTHLRDVGEVDPFYYALLESLSHHFTRSAKRAVIEHYVTLLDHEGRLHEDMICFLCEKRVGGSVALVRSFLPAHPECVYEEGFSIEKVHTLFHEQKTLLLEDSEIEGLYNVLLQGI